MSWFWESYEDYKKWVGPSGRSRTRNNDDFKLRTSTRFEIIKELNDSVEELTKAIKSLQRLDLTGRANEDEVKLGQAKTLVGEAVGSGELMLLYQKRLAKSRWSQDFLVEKQLLQDWETYSGRVQIYYELNRFIPAAKKLLDGFHEFRKDDEEFLGQVVDLPKDLAHDFLLARNLFSTGFDEVGTLIAGRGLEGVLREVAKIKRLFL